MEKNENMKKYTNKSLNRIAPPPPPPIISNYIIEETLQKAYSLTRSFLSKIPKLASISALWCAAAPLKRQKSSLAGFFSIEGRFFHKLRSLRGPCLSILLLTATLGLTHCKSDDNGGGGGGDPEPEPIGPAIYLWITGCTVPGDMSGDGMGGACDNTDTGVAGADSICGSRYAEDVASEHRTTIMEQHETGTLQHKALLASSGGDSNLPQNFDINGKDSQPLRRPDGTQIAPSWAAFFDGGQDIDNSVFGTENLYWSGLQWVPADQEYILGLPMPIFLIATQTCSDWSTSMLMGTGVPAPTNFGRLGNGGQTDEKRIDISSTGSNAICNLGRALLCITH